MTRSFHERYGSGAGLGMAAACLLAACATDDPQPEKAPDPLDTSAGDPYRCEETTRALAAAEVTPFGFAAQSVSARALGVHEVPLSWDEGAVSYEPEHGSSLLTLEVSEISSVEFVDQRLVARAGWVIPEGVTDESYGCRDRIRMQGLAQVRTTQGALNDTRQVTFEVGPSAIAIGRVDLPLASLGGSFQGGATPPEDSALVLSFGVGERAVAGALLYSPGEGHGSDGSLSNSTPTPIAHFPSTIGCGPDHGMPSEGQVLRRTLIADALTLLNSMAPVQAQREDSGATASPATVLELSFSSDESACLDSDAPLDAALPFSGQVMMSSDDGSIAGTLDVELVSLRDLGRVTASASDVSEDPTRMLDLPASFGIQQPVAMSGYRAGSVEFVAGVDQLAAWGSLRAYGVGEQCPAPEAAPPEGGCDGSERSLLWGKSWGTPPSDP